jgi:hypothetical protein
MAAETVEVWSALSLEGSGSVFPSLMNPCLSHTLLMSPTQIGVGGRRLVHDPMTSRDSGS